VNTGHEADNAALTAFIDYFLSDEGIGYVTEADYIALPEAEIEATRAAWDGR
jgi:ABC-type phosphate transport system substrate-binding protein